MNGPQGPPSPEEAPSEWHHSPAGDVVREVVRLMSPPMSPSGEPIKRHDSDPAPMSAREDLRASTIDQPGGFRRHYVGSAAARRHPTLAGRIRGDPLILARFRLIKRDSSDDEDDNGSCMGSEDDDDDNDDIEIRTDAEGRALELAADLLRGARGSRLTLTEESRAAALERRKRADIRQTVFSLAKSFVGPGVLFLPRAFLHGGLSLSLAMMIGTCWVSLYCMLELVRCATSEHDTFGDIGRAACGFVGGFLVDFSVFVSQVGFCAIYGVFVAKNVQDVVLTLSGCNPAWRLPLGMLIAAQALIYVPLSWVRRLKYFSVGILAADAFIVIGLLAVTLFSASSIATVGLASEIKTVNLEQWPLMFGTLIFMWEGVGLILPVRSAMKEHLQPRYPGVLRRTIGLLLCLYCFVGSLAYAAFGATTSSVVLLNLPDQNWTCAVQAIYVMAVALTYPIQLFPAIKIAEHLVFGRGGAVTTARKWRKNVVRAELVIFALVVSYLGSTQLDNFIALIGALCCLPLSLVYPPLFTHILRPQRPRSSRVLGLVIMVVGSAAMAWTVYHTLATWTTEDVPTRCDTRAAMTTAMPDGTPTTMMMMMTADPMVTQEW